MTVAEKARHVLENLRLPPKPQVLGIAVEDYVDSTGDDSLRVDVLLDDATTDEELGEDTERMIQTIKESLLQAGIEEFPYVFIALPSELAEVEDE